MLSIMTYVSHSVSPCQPASQSDGAICQSLPRSPFYPSFLQLEGGSPLASLLPPNLKRLEVLENILVLQESSAAACNWHLRHWSCSLASILEVTECDKASLATQSVSVEAPNVMLLPRDCPPSQLATWQLLSPRPLYGRHIPSPSISKRECLHQPLVLS